MNNPMDIQELMDSINMINGMLIPSNYMLREAGVVGDDIYNSLRCSFISDKIDEAIRYLDSIYMDCYKISYNRREAANV